MGLFLLLLGIGSKYQFVQKRKLWSRGCEGGQMAENGVRVPRSKRRSEDHRGRGDTDLWNWVLGRYFWGGGDLPLQPQAPLRAPCTEYWISLHGNPWRVREASPSPLFQAVLIYRCKEKTKMLCVLSCLNFAGQKEKEGVSIEREGMGGPQPWGEPKGNSQENILQKAVLMGLTPGSDLVELPC